MNNSTFQKKMNSFPAIGIAGGRLMTNPIVYYCQTLVAVSKISCGNFVWLSGEGVESTGNGKPLGIAMPLSTYSNYDSFSSASNQIPANNFLSICLKGDLFAMSTSNAERGEKVFANLSDGTIKTAESGTSLENAIETDFYVVSGGNIGDIIVISNWL